MRRLLRSSEWRRESLRTTLWFVPTIQVVLAGVLFVITYAIDKAASHNDLSLPTWLNAGSADAGRQVLIAIAAAVITVVGLVFSITIVALTLASTQFGPRMLRNFVRDRGTQITLGTFVATFVYAILALGSISNSGRETFVPHLSITMALFLVLVDLGVLIYFIHHIAKSIQLPQVIAAVARDLAIAVDAEVEHNMRVTAVAPSGPSINDVRARLAAEGAAVPATQSGYLQFVQYDTLSAIAAESDAVIQMLYRPGHFVVQGLPLATVWPAVAAPQIARSLERLHVAGSHRTLAQDLAFAIDQLVEIAIRALSPAVNDTFTALTCIDWLSDGLCKITAQWDPHDVHRDRSGSVRVLAVSPSYGRYIDRAFDKVRQAGRGMPAVFIRQLDALTKIARFATTTEQHAVLGRQAEMIRRAANESIPETNDRADVDRAWTAFEVAIAGPAPVRVHDGPG